MFIYLAHFRRLVTMIPVIAACLVFDINTAIGESLTTLTYYSQKKTWNEAHFICSNDGGYLFKEDTSKKTDLLNIFDGVSPWSSENFNTGFWIGLVADLTSCSNTFHWSDCQPLTYDDWHPSDPKSPCSKNCIYKMKPNQNWKTSECYVIKAFICEKQGGACPEDSYSDITGKPSPSLSSSTNNVNECRQFCEQASCQAFAYNSGSGACSVFLNDDPYYFTQSNNRKSSGGTTFYVRHCYKLLTDGSSYGNIDSDVSHSISCSAVVTTTQITTTTPATTTSTAATTTSTPETTTSTPATTTSTPETTTSTAATTTSTPATTTSTPETTTSTPATTTSTPETTTSTAATTTSTPETTTSTPETTTSTPATTTSTAATTTSTPETTTSTAATTTSTPETTTSTPATTTSTPATTTSTPETPSTPATTTSTPATTTSTPATTTTYSDASTSVHSTITIPLHTQTLLETYTTTSPYITLYNEVCPSTNLSSNCVCYLKQNVTEESDLQALIETIKQELRIQKSLLTLPKLKKISASDNRTSAQVMGWLAVLVIIIVTSLIVVSDILKVVYFVYSTLKSLVVHNNVVEMIEMQELDSFNNIDANESQCNQNVSDNQSVYPEQNINKETEFSNTNITNEGDAHNTSNRQDTTTNTFTHSAEVHDFTRIQETENISHLRNRPMLMQHESFDI